MKKWNTFRAEKGVPIQRAAEKLGLLLLGMGPLLVFAGAWTAHRWDKLFGSWAYFWGALGNLFAMLALSLAVVMVWLGARNPWVERRFGLDRMLRLHQVLGPVVVGLLAAHALLRTVKLSLLSTGGWQWTFLYTLNLGSLEEAAFSAARIALALLFVTAGLAKMGRYFLPFHLWKVPHLALYVFVPLGLAHSIIVGDDMVRFPYFVVWLALLLAFLLAVLQRVRYVKTRKQLYSGVLVETLPETHDTKTLRIAPKAGPASFGARRPGQFGVIRYKRVHGYSQPRPFTISAPPVSETLTFTVKKTGRFTRKLHKLREKSEFLCEGPYGVFVPDFQREKNLVMIAGGVGITPFLSMLRHMRQTGLDAEATLIWANKTRKDCIACDELTGMAADGLVKVVHVLSREAPPKDAPQTGPVSFEGGHVDGPVLKKYVDSEKASFYLCGPPAMQEAVLDELKKTFGIRRRHVKRERFFW